MSRAEIHVVPGSPRPGPDGRHGGIPRLRVRAPARDGRANAEAEQVLSRVLAVRVRVVSGARSRRKVVEADLPAEVLRRRLEAVFGREEGGPSDG